MIAEEIFAFVALRPCGCVCQACTPHALAAAMRNRHFKEQMKAGKIRTIANREEWDKLSWKCSKPES